MGNSKPEDAKIITMAAAFLRSKGMFQQKIAEELGIKQPDVSRYLKDAEQRHWLEFPPPCFHGADVAKELWARAEARFFPKQSIIDHLSKRYVTGGARLRRVTEIRGAATEAALPPSIVDIVRSLLSKVETVGVTWGRTIGRLVATLRSHIPDPPRRHQPIRFVPLCGEPLKERGDPSKYSSSALAVQLGEIFNGPKQSSPPSLAGVPAFIPSRFAKKTEVDTIKQFIRQFAGYTAVFGEEEVASNRENSLVNSLGAVLTSVGVVAKKYRGIFLDERIGIKDITEAEAARCVAGDLGGILIPKKGLTDSENQRIKDMNERWTGFKQSHLESCASGASAGKPGVIVLAFGGHRLDVVERCVDLGLVNELIIDAELAHALESTPLHSRQGE